MRSHFDGGFSHAESHSRLSVCRTLLLTNEEAFEFLELPLFPGVNELGILIAAWSAPRERSPIPDRKFARP